MKYEKYLVYDLKQNDRIKHFFLLNSANVALLLSTISVGDAKSENETKLVSNKLPMCMQTKDLYLIYL